MRNHWSDEIVEDIVGAFKIFFISAILIFVALAVTKSLYPTFPLDNTSSGVVSTILGLFFVFIKFVKRKNKYSGKKEKRG
jgi:hypothetical protein